MSEGAETEEERPAEAIWELSDAEELAGRESGARSLVMPEI